MEKHDPEPEVKYVDIQDLHSNPWNRKLEREKLDGIKSKIRDTGQIMPLVVTEVDKRGKKVLAVTDGHHRLAALKELGHDGAIPVVMADERGTKTAKEMKPKALKRATKKYADVIRDMTTVLNKGIPHEAVLSSTFGMERLDVSPSAPAKKPYEKTKKTPEPKTIDLIRDLVAGLNRAGMTKVAEMAVEGLGLVREDLGVRRKPKAKQDE